MLNARRDNEIVRLLLLHDEPHTLNVVLSVAPVAQRVHIAQLEVVLQTLGYPACRECDLAGNEILAAALRLVVEEYAVYREHTVSLAVLLYHPEAVLLSDGVGAVRVERRSFALGNFLYLAVKLRGRSLIYLGLFLNAEHSYSLEYPQHAYSVNVARVFGNVE